MKFCSVSINFFVHSIQRHKLHTRSPGRRIGSRIVAIYMQYYIPHTYRIVETAIANMESAMCWCGASRDYDDIINTMGEFAYVLTSRYSAPMLNCWFTLLFCSKDKRHDENIKVINKNIISLGSVSLDALWKQNYLQMWITPYNKTPMNNSLAENTKAKRPSKRHK